MSSTICSISAATASLVPLIDDPSLRGGRAPGPVRTYRISQQELREGGGEPTCLDKFERAINLARPGGH